MKLERKGPKIWVKANETGRQMILGDGGAGWARGCCVRAAEVTWAAEELGAESRAGQDSEMGAGKNRGMVMTKEEWEEQKRGDQQ